MLVTSISVLLPVLFVMALGYWAGRSKEITREQVGGINELVMDFALPALTFVATVKTTRSEMFAQVPFLLAILIGFAGIYLATVLVSLYVLRHSLGEAAVQAALVAFPSVSFFGIPIFRGLFGESSILTIALASVTAMVTLVPLTVVLLEIHTQRAQQDTPQEIGTLIRGWLVNSFKRPMVWAPLLGAALVLLDFKLPDEIDAMLSLIGSGTGGASIFLAGLIIAAYNIKISAEVIGNVIAKMIAQPLLMVGLVAALGVANPLAREAILMCAIPTAVFAPMLAPRYHVYEKQASSTLVLTSLTMIVTFPIAIALVGAT
jgi:auxin efflux carrier (AEC)